LPHGKLNVFKTMQLFKLKCIYNYLSPGFFYAIPRMPMRIRFWKFYARGIWPKIFLCAHFNFRFMDWLSSNLTDLSTVLSINLTGSWTVHKSDRFVDSPVHKYARFLDSHHKSGLFVDSHHKSGIFVNSPVHKSATFLDSHHKSGIFVDSPAHTTFKNLCTYAQHVNLLMRLSLRSPKMPFRNFVCVAHEKSLLVTREGATEQ